jgi:hypothetical protein
MKKSLVLLALILVGLIMISGCGEETATPVEEPERNGEDFRHDHDDESEDHGHEHGDEPYEWSGLLNFEVGEYTMVFQKSGDPSIGVVFVLDEGDREASDHLAYHIFEVEMETVPADGSFDAMIEYGYDLQLNSDVTTITFNIIEAGNYLLYMEHMPREFDLVIYNSDGEEMVPDDVVEY